jgi:predicted enzyme related to lactoylglutathione lyase
MGERTQYTPGTFCWTDLTTSDQTAAKGFYASIFGWEAEDMPVGDGAVYSMQRLDGKDVGAISPQQQAQVDAGAPPAWNSYVSVESADAAAEKASELGATVMAEPFDVMDVGRMAVIQDPQGAFILVWEPGRHFGASLVNAAGALAWNELASPDLDASAAFYGALFGWTFEAPEGTPIPYRLIKNGDANNGGISQVQPGAPPHWLNYFGSDDVAATLSEVESLGGGVLLAADDIGMGTIGIARDAQGATFGLFAGQFED